MTGYESTERVAYDYAKFPREFISYRWFKPILVAALAFVFYFALVLLLAFAVGVWTGGFDYLGTISEGYDDMDVYTGPGALIGLGTVALMMLALALAGLIVRDRPFSSYLSSRGGWNWKTFLWCLLIAIAVMVVDFVVEYALFPTSSGDGLNHFTAIGIVLCIVLTPLQCVAEEVIFRGFILQTVSSWTKLPIVGIIISAIAFAAGHPYNLYGVIVIFLNGIFWGFVAWKSNGLEATSALHIVNNFVAFLTAGFGLSATTSEVPIEAIAVSAIIDVVYAVAVLGLGKKFGWFEPTGDDATNFNEKKRAKLASKQQKRGMQDAPQPPLTPQAAQVPRVQQAQQV